MNYIVVGCGRIGADLAYRLFKRGHKVSVIDRSAAAFYDLPADFRGRTVEGEGLEKEVLHRAGIEQADGLVAVTSSDSVNAVVCHVARSVYGVSNVVTRNYDSRRRHILEAFGLQTISPASWGAQRLEEVLYHGEVHTVFSAGNGEVEIYEFVVPQGWSGRTVGEFLDESQCTAVALTRAGRALLPALDTVMEGGDIIHLSATLDGIRSVCLQFNGKEGEAACLY